jgi:hypothetical protein
MVSNRGKWLILQKNKAETDYKNNQKYTSYSCCYLIGNMDAT